MNHRLSFVWLIFLSSTLCSAGNWPAWRGPTGDGVSTEKNPPLTWTNTENVLWKAPLPGKGNSTPIVWEDRVFVTCAKDRGHVRGVLCYDRNNGKLLWQGNTDFIGDEPTYPENPYCAASPITDGKSVFAMLGSAGVVAYDFSGKLLWKHDLGALTHIWGNAGSPILYKQSLILNCGPGLRCFLVALDRETGRELWKRDLPEAVAKDAGEFKGSWSSPLLFEIEGMPHLIVDLPGYVAGFNPDTGEEMWRCLGMGALAYAQPLVSKEYIVSMSGYGGPAIGLRTPKAGERGDITKSNRLWVAAGGNPQRVGSGVLVGDRVYINNTPGTIECIAAATGKPLWKTRGNGSSWGSVVYVDGKLFCSDQSGETIIWAPGDKPDILHHNALHERTNASLVFSDGQIFIRTFENLYCIGKRAVKE